jgi:hypothetical protein
MSLSPVHSLPEAFNGIYVQGLTQVKAVLSATPIGTSIKYYDVTVDGKTYGSDNNYTSGYLANHGEIPVVGRAVDGREYPGYANGSITVIPYAHPKIQNTTAKRCDENGNPTTSGEYLKITAKRSYQPVLSGGVQKNFCSIRYRYKTEEASYYSDWETILDGHDLSSDEVATGPLLDGGLLVTKSYRVEVQAIDDVGNVATSEIIVPTENVYWHRDGARNALGLGKYNEQDNALDSAWDIFMNGHNITGLADPVEDTDAVNLGFLRKIEQPLKPITLTADNIDSGSPDIRQFTIGYGIFGSAGYVSFYIGWTILQFRVVAGSQIERRAKYGDNGWSPWVAM